MPVRDKGTARHAQANDAPKVAGFAAGAGWSPEAVTMDREGKKWLVSGKPFICPNCGWVLKQAASNTDIKRNIVCQCPDFSIVMPPKEGSNE